MNKIRLAKLLDDIYAHYNKRSLVSPDPLQFLYEYETPADREIVALVAASLAYGRVGQILKSVEKVLREMNPSPAEFISRSAPMEFDETFSVFKHRFTTGVDLAALMKGIKTCVEEFGSLERAFLDGYSDNDADVAPALANFADKLCRFHTDAKSYLVPSPIRGSACKRPLLFLRWMIRRDDVDPGGWTRIPPSKLIVPLDTHMHSIAIRLGLAAKQGSANLKRARAITAKFAELAPDDPVKYDFALTRFGIRDDMSVADLPRSKA